MIRGQIPLSAPLEDTAACTNDCDPKRDCGNQGQPNLERQEIEPLVKI
jgi:hypothetical protein